MCLNIYLSLSLSLDIGYKRKDDENEINIFINNSDKSEVIDLSIYLSNSFKWINENGTNVYDSFEKNDEEGKKSKKRKVTSNSEVTLLPFSYLIAIKE